MPGRPAAALALLLALPVLAGCLGAGDPGPGSAVPSAPPVAAEGPPAFTNLTGTLVALPLVGGEHRFSYEVPEGAAWAAANLRWATRGARIELTAMDPSGEPRGEVRRAEVAAGASPVPRLDWWSEAPAPGTWTFLVRGAAALQEPLHLQLHTLGVLAGAMHVAGAHDVAGFVELVTRMEEGATLAFAWEASEPVRFDIHTHRDGGTQYHVEHEGASMNGTFAADRDDAFGVQWTAGPGPVGDRGREVVLAYRLDGDFDFRGAFG